MLLSTRSWCLPQDRVGENTGDPDLLHLGVPLPLLLLVLLLDVEVGQDDVVEGGNVVDELACVGPTAPRQEPPHALRDLDEVEQEQEERHSDHELVNLQQCPCLLCCQISVIDSCLGFLPKIPDRDRTKNETVTPEFLKSSLKSKTLKV